jgi:hypothetical protein
MALRSKLAGVYCENGRYGYSLALHHQVLGLIGRIKTPARYSSARAAKSVAREAIKALATISKPLTLIGEGRICAAKLERASLPADCRRIGST